MKQSLHIWPEEATIKNGLVETGFTIEYPDGARKRIWYRLHEVHSSDLINNCDPYIVAMIFPAMRTPADLVIHGEISPSLLRSLGEFQAAWGCWRPDRYTPIDITGDIEKERSKPEDAGTLTAFSAGVDSCFTVWRHYTKQAGSQTRKLDAGLMLLGFDIPLSKADTYRRAFKKTKLILESVGMDAIQMANNQWNLGGNRDDSHGSILASSLMMLGGKYKTGMIPSTHTYQELNLRWGSNPATDGLLSSNSFAIVHDGAAFSRIEKMPLIAGWPEAMQNLRVCLVRESETRDNNCCRCEKCVRTILAFRALGLGLPPAFEHDVSDRQVRKIDISSPGKIHYFKTIHQTAIETGNTGSWLKAINNAIFINRIKYWAKKYPAIPNTYRKLRRNK